MTSLMRSFFADLRLCAAIMLLALHGALAAEADMFVITGPDKIEVGVPASFTVDPANATPFPATASVVWYCNKSRSGEGRTLTHTPVSFDPVRVEATVSDNGKRLQQVVREIEVVGRKDYGINVTFKLPNVMGPEEQVSGTVVFSSPERFYHNAVSCVMREEPTGRILREPGEPMRGSSMKPAHEYYVAFKAPKDPGKYTLVAELIGENDSKDRSVIARGTFEFEVPRVVLTMPAAVTALEIFDVSATVEGADNSLIEEYRWWPAPLISDITQARAKMQLSGPENVQTGTTRVTLTILGKDRRMLARTESQITVRRANLESALPDGWSGPLTSLKRKTATRRRVESGRETASAVIDAWVTVTVVRNDGSYFNSPERFNREMENDAGSWGAVPERIALAGFSGILYQSPLRVDYRSGSRADATPVESSCRGRAVLQNGAYIMNLTYFVGGRGMRFGLAPKYWWDDMSFVRQESQTALKEIRAIVSGLKIVPEGGVIMPPAQPQAALTVRLNAAATTIRKGASVAMTAQVENLKAGDKAASYTWSAGVAGKTAQATFTPDKPGVQTVTVNVKTVQGAAGAASMKFAVEDFNVTLKKEKPAAPSATIGDEAALLCALDGTRPAIAPFYRWKSSGAVSFDPVEGTSPKTTARFTAAGPAKIWVEAYEKVRDTESLLAIAAPIEMTVAAPALTVSAADAAPYIGRESVVKVLAVPEMKNAEYQWDVTGGAKIVPSRDGRSAAVTAMSVAPVTVTVRGKLKGMDVPFGEATVQIVPKGYAVRVETRGPQGPGPKLWQDGKGLVENKDAVSVGRPVRLVAIVEPAPDGKSIFAWTTGEQGRIDGAADKSEVLVSAAATGPCKVFVSVRDKNGVVLGSGDGGFTVTVSADDIAAAAARAQTADSGVEAQKKLETLTALAAEGKLNEALLQGESALKEYAGNKSLSVGIAALKDERLKITAALERMKIMIAGEKLAPARKEFEAARLLNANYAPVIEAEKMLDQAFAAYDQKQKDRERTDKEKAENDRIAREARVKAAADALKAGNEAFSSGKIDEALATVRAVLKNDPANAELTAFIDTTIKKQTALVAALTRVKSALGENNIDAARQAHAEAAAVCAASSGVAEAQQLIDQAGLVNNVMYDAKELARQGQIDDAIAILEKGVKENRRNEAMSRELSSLKEKRAVAIDAAGRAATLADQGLFAEARAALAGQPRYTYVKDAAFAIAQAEEKAREQVKAVPPPAPAAPVTAAVPDEKKRAEAVDKIKQARSFASDGKLDDAFIAAAAAASADPQNADAAVLVAELKSMRARITAAIENMDRMIREEKLADAQRELTTARGINEKYPAVMAAEKTLDDAFSAYDRRKKEEAEKDKAGRAAAEKDAAARDKKARELRAAIEKARARAAAGDLNAALVLVRDLLTRETQNADLAVMEKELTGKQAAVQSSLARMSQLISVEKLDEARVELDKAVAVSADYAPVREAQKTLAAADAAAQKARVERDAQAEKERKARERLAQASKDSLDTAAARAADGDLDAATRVIEKALKDDAGNAALAVARNDYSQQKAKIAAALAQARQQADAAQFDPARRAWEAAAAVNAKYGELSDVKKYIDTASEKYERRQQEKAEKEKSVRDAQEKETSKEEEAAAKKAPQSGPVGGGISPVPALIPVPVPSLSAPAIVPAVAAAAPAADDAAKKRAADARELFVAAAKLFSEYRDAVITRKDKYRDFGKLNDAIDKLEESLKLASADDAAELLKNVQGEYGARRKYLETVDRSAKLLKEAARLADKREYRESLATYDESMKLHAPEDPEAVQQAIEKVKALELSTRADVMRKEADQLEKRGKLPEAVEKYQAALAACSPQYPFRTQVQIAINDLQKRLMSAEGWCLSGEIKEGKGELKEALADYAKSLTFYDDEGVRKHIDMLKNDIVAAAKNPRPVAAPAPAPVAVPAAAPAPLAVPAPAPVVVPPPAQPAVSTAPVVPVVPEVDLIPAVRQLYADLAVAFQAKNADQMLAFLATDWMTADGTKPADIREHLLKAFKNAVEVRCEIQNVIVIRSAPGMYRSRYMIEMAIRNKDAETPRSERGIINDELAADGKGGVRIKRTISGRFWPAE